MISVSSLRDMADSRIVVGNEQQGGEHHDRREHDGDLHELVEDVEQGLQVLALVVDDLHAFAPAEGLGDDFVVERVLQLDPEGDLHVGLGDVVLVPRALHLLLVVGQGLGLGLEGVGVDVFGDLARL